MQTPQRNELHQRTVCSRVNEQEPDCADGQRCDHDGALEGLLQSQLSSDCPLEEDDSNDDTIAHHRPAPARRMLTMLHRVEQLVLVDELAYDKIRQPDQKYLPRVPQDAVDNADDEYQYGLRQKEAIAEDWWLYKFCIIYCTSQYQSCNELNVQQYLGVSSLP